MLPETNPFVHLFENYEEALRQHEATQRQNEKEVENERLKAIKNKYIERIFLFTLSKNTSTANLIDLSHLIKLIPKSDCFSQESLNFFLYECLETDTRSVELTTGLNKSSPQVSPKESNPIMYLSNCYIRLYNIIVPEFFEEFNDFLSYGQLADHKESSAIKNFLFNCYKVIKNEGFLRVANPKIFSATATNDYLKAILLDNTFISSLDNDLHVHFFLMICNLMYEERVACYKATKDPEYHPMFPSLLPSSELHSLYVLFQPLLSQIKHKLLSMKLNDPSIPAVFNALQFFHSSFYNQQNDNSLARILLQFNNMDILKEKIKLHKQPHTSSKLGFLYGDSLLGRLFSLSCVPSSEFASCDFYMDTSLLDGAYIERVDSFIHSLLDDLHGHLEHLMKGLLKMGGVVKHETLSFVAGAIMSNKDRSKIWTIEQSAILPTYLSSDSFFINITSTLTRLFSPFIKQHDTFQKIQLHYSSASLQGENDKRIDIHMRNICETRLVPQECNTANSINTAVNNPSATNTSTTTTTTAEPTLSIDPPPETFHDAQSLDNLSFSFSTELFFMVHCSLNVGFNVVQVKFNKINEEVARVMARYKDVRANLGVNSSEEVHLKEDLERMAPLFYCYKSLLTHPSSCQSLFSFHSFTAAFLTHIIKKSGGSDVDADADDLLIGYNAGGLTDANDGDASNNNNNDDDEFSDKSNDKNVFICNGDVTKTQKNLLKGNKSPQNNINDKSGNKKNLRTGDYNIKDSTMNNKNNNENNSKNKLSLNDFESNDDLRYVPEFVLENIQKYVLFIRNFKSDLFKNSPEEIHNIFIFSIIFCSSPSYVNNPHLRSELASVISSFLPSNEANLFFTFNRTNLFTTNPCSQLLFPIMISLYVDTETTGQEGQFETKFQLRLPIYHVIKHICQYEQHKKVMKCIAEFAENHADDTEVPIFLRFINLLVNDAIHLLDEALRLMGQVKEQEEEMRGEAWNSLSRHQKLPAQLMYERTTKLARFHNIMAMSTISCLATLTIDTKSFFCHPIMVDRLTSMLNYFLLHLVGPKKKNLVVNDKSKQAFKPKELVREICSVYINLSDNQAFLKAICRDGRSYSTELFKNAELVLCRIQEPVDVIFKFNQIAADIKRLAEEQAREDEETLNNVPDNFLDPIMGHLMVRPVRLPSSGVVLDRTTIARHLLSDQTDPFNRQTLTMQMVEDDDDLMQQIQQWIKTNGSKKKFQDEEEDGLNKGEVVEESGFDNKE